MNASNKSNAKSYIIQPYAGHWCVAVIAGMT